MRIGRLVILATLAATLAGCSGEGLGRFGWGKDRQTFDGQHYRGASKSARSDRHDFTASARPVSASLDGAIEAATYEGVKHCLKYFGTSDIAWTVGPDTPRETLVITDDTLSFAGRCQE